MGYPEGGITIFSRSVAAQVGQAREVVEFHLELRHCRALAFMAETWAIRRRIRASGATVVVLQYSPWLWAPGRGLARLAEALVLYALMPCRVCVVLHDTAPADFTAPLRAGHSMEPLVLALHRMLAKPVIVLNEVELQNMRVLALGSRVVLIPLYIASQPTSASSPSSAHDRSSGGSKTLGVVGFIHQGKNPLLPVEALPFLPGHVRLEFIGGPTKEAEPLVESMVERAKQLGVEQRLEITGYVPEEELHRRIHHVDLGLCLYQNTAASASLSMLLSMRVPVLVSSAPAFREYAREAPAAVTVVDFTAPERIAEAIERCLEDAPRHKDQLERLLAMRSLPRFCAHFEAALFGTH